MRQALFAFDSDAPNEFPAPASHDARADGGCRRILLAPSCVTIMRRLQGVKMHLLVPAKSYAGVVLACEEHPSGVVFSIRLAHRDPELSVSLGTASNRGASIDAWRQWAAYFAVPALIERASVQWEIIDPLPLSGAAVTLPALPHRCTGASSKRRRRLALCRKWGRTSRQARTFRGSRVIRP
jgi:Family of unknown function (DUF6101)